MKFKTNRAELQSGFKRFLTRGRLTLGSTEKNLVKKASLVTGDNYVKFVGADEGGAIYARLILDADVSEQGRVILGDLLSFHEFIKTLTDEDVTITVNDSTVTVEDSKSSMGFGIEVVTFYKPVTQWDQYHEYDKGTVKYTKGDVTYTRWFDIEKSEVFNKVVSSAQRLVRSNKIKFAVGTDLEIECVDTETKRHYKDTFDVNPETIESYVIEYIYPVLNNLTGPAEFYYYTNSKGHLRVWIHNGVLEWMVKYNKQQPK